MSIAGDPRYVVIDSDGKVTEHNVTSVVVRLEDSHGRVTLIDNPQAVVRITEH